MKILNVLLLLTMVFFSEKSTSGLFAEIMEKEELVRLGPLQNCGSPPPEPNAFDKLINNAKMKASENYDMCQRANARRKQLMAGQEYAQQEVAIENSCQNAVRKMSSNPSTLAFDYKRNWKITDGGYSVIVTGSDIRGQFSVTCYMDKYYNITNVR